MGKHMGSEKLGSFYTGKKARRRREWRGVRDTMYDYAQWLRIWGVLLRFAAKPNNVKAFFRYRWMLNYLVVPDFFDRHTEGMRGAQLRITHTALSIVVIDMCKSMTRMFKADPNIGNDEKLRKRMVLFDENMMSEIMNGFPNLIWVSVEVPAVYTCAMMVQDGVVHYTDAAQTYGVPSDVCPMPLAELGVALEDDYPRIGACAVHCNTTCDGSLMGNSIEGQYFGIPTYELAVPIRHTYESVQPYAVEEIKNCIAFIEKHTGETFDWNAFFKSMELFNAETQNMLDWFEISRTKYPQMIGTNLALYRYCVYQATGGRYEVFRKVEEKLNRYIRRGYERKELVCREIRHRAITWGVQSAYYTAFTVWLQNCWGVAALVDMLSLCSTRMVDTHDKEQALKDLAYLYGKMIMRSRSNGGYEVGVEDLWRFCESFDVDVVIMYCHMGCKAMSGYHGLFEEEARKHGIHLIWVNHNLMKPEDGSRKDMRMEVNRYMRTVFREEPLDPSLEDFDDDRNW